jgi:hypothetical protein
MDWGESLCSFLGPDGNEFDLKQPVRGKFSEPPKPELFWER